MPYQIRRTRTNQGVTTFSKFWMRSARCGQNEARTSPAQPVFCRQSEMFCQLPNGRFSQNLATTRESMSPRMVSEEIFENVSFRGHLPLKTSKLEGVKQAPYGDQPLVQKTHCKKILIFILCPRAREFSNLFNFFYTTYSFGPSKFPNFPILPIFPIQYA